MNDIYLIMQQNLKWKKQQLLIRKKKVAKKVDLYSLKSKVDKLDVHRLETVPANLNKIGNVVDNDIADVVNDIDTSELVKEVNAFDTSDLVRKLPTTYKR